MSILDAALSWAARGFRVFPITPGDKVPPKGLAWKIEATTDPAKIRAWWAFEPNYNYAVAAGDGTLVVDIDAGKNGYASLLYIDTDLPATLTVKTPGGGEHRYYTGPDVQNSVDRIAPGIDIRSAGGYVIGPGSYFADPGGKKGYTGAYRIVHDADTVDAPNALVLMCGEAKQREHGPAISVDAPDDIAFAVHYLQKDAPVAIEGQGGNNTAYAVAARVIEIGVSAERAADLMAEHWNERCLPPWPREELRGIVEHASTYMLRPQGASSAAAAIANDWGGSVALPAEPPPTSAGKFDRIFAIRTLKPIEQIQARPWIMHRLLLRNEVAIVAGPGGVGKSGFSLAVAAHGAAGRSLASFRVDKPFKTIVYNLEDDREEMTSRLYAACAVYDMDPREIEKHVILWPGRETRLKLMNRDHTPAMADIKEVARLAKLNGLDAMILDPLVSMHSEEENDNTAMGEVMETLNGLARLSGIAVLAVHHAPKAVRQAGSSDAVRGAGNIVNTVRIAHTIYEADEADAALYGFADGYKGRYARVDDAKQSRQARDTKPVWFEKQSFPLPCGDTSLMLRLIEPSSSMAGEAGLIARILAARMKASASIHLATYDAAKILVTEDQYFRDKLAAASGQLRHIKTLIELRLSQPVQTDSGATLRVIAKTEPGAQSARTFVEVIDAASSRAAEWGA